MSKKLTRKKHNPKIVVKVYVDAKVVVLTIVDKDGNVETLVEPP
jgi:hypothetical protein